MTPEEIREQLHRWVNELSEEQLLLLQESAQLQQQKDQRMILLNKIIAEDASLLKQLGR